jgi:hypothetical protein
MISKRREFNFFSVDVILIINCFLVAISLSWYPILGKGYPLFKFLTSEVGRFDDFWNYRISSFEILFPTNANFTLYPLSVPIYQIFGALEYRISLLTFISFFLFVIMIFMIKITKSWKYFLLFLTLYPTVFTIARGNNELILFTLLLIFVYLYNVKSYRSAVFTLVLMQFIEVVPFFLLTIIKYLRKILLYFVIISMFFLVVFILQYGFLDFRLYTESLLSFSSNYSVAIHPGSSLHSISLSGLLQTIYFLISDVWPTSDLTFFVALNYLILLLGLISVFIFSIFKKISMSDRLIFYSGVWCLCRSVSFDYSMIYLVLPFFIILSDLNSNPLTSPENKKFRFYSHDHLIFLMLFLLFIPKPFIWFTSTENPLGSSLGSLVNPLILVIILLLVLKKNFAYINFSRK